LVFQKIFFGFSLEITLALLQFSSHFLDHAGFLNIGQCCCHTKIAFINECYC